MSGMRLLLIEDYRPVRESLAKGLREAGYAVDATGDGEEGLWYARGNDYDVMILDLMLPGVDGWELLGRLREHPQTRDIPVVICTILPQERLALALGAAALLQKPFTRDALLSMLAGLTRSQD